jgi:hypothetical protein
VDHRPKGNQRRSCNKQGYQQRSPSLIDPFHKGVMSWQEKPNCGHRAAGFGG